MALRAHYELQEAKYKREREREKEHQVEYIMNIIQNVKSSFFNITKGKNELYFILEIEDCMNKMLCNKFIRHKIDQYMYCWQLYGIEKKKIICVLMT